MKDILLEKMFEMPRWEKAIDVAVSKGITKKDLIDLSTPKTRSKLYVQLQTGQLKVIPPHQALIPKDNGEFRTVYINENVDRVLLSIINDLLFEMFPERVHKQCKSYQIGIGCGKVVKEVSKHIVNIDSNVVGLKADLTKYFDSVPIRFIDEIFDRIESKVGKSCVIDYLRSYYHCDLCFDTENNLITHYQSLKQGCAIASFLADALLYEIDDYFFNHSDYYVRYSDDLLIIGKNVTENYELLKQKLDNYELVLNPKKVETLQKDKFFKFLGFSIRGSEISLSKSRIKKFQKEIEARTILDKTNNFERAVSNVNRFLYKGDYCWATSVLSVINVQEDIKTLNCFVMDCLRAVKTNRKKLYGLGYEIGKKQGVITAGKGKNVTSNRLKTDKIIDNYKTLGCMKKAMSMSSNLFRSIARQL